MFGKSGPQILFLFMADIMEYLRWTTTHPRQVLRLTFKRKWVGETDQGTQHLVLASLKLLSGLGKLTRIGGYLPHPYQLLEYQTDMRRCRFDTLGKQTSAHLAGGTNPVCEVCPPARWAKVYFPKGINLGQCSLLHRAESWVLVAQTLVMKYLW